jgi:CCR4-NOT transcription complex subunit 1
MIHNLFDEYRFFPKYPDKELIITGELFGSLIRDQLMSPVRLALGLRIVLDSLKKQLGSKMFRFGLTALLQFRNRLHEWPQYCSHLLQVNHLMEANPEVAQMLNQALAISSSKDKREQQPRESDGIIAAGVVSSVGRMADSRSLSLASNGAEVPNDVARDKLLFVINNISFSNIDTKSKDLAAALKPEVYGWFSNYLVVKRVSIEPNFHSLYVALLDSLGLADLRKNVLAETLKNIRILLTSEKTLTSSQERSLLKNLGSWLGGITLAKDKPIKHNELPLKVYDFSLIVPCSYFTNS